MHLTPFEFAKSKGATELELEIIRTYFELDPAIRKTVISHFMENLGRFRKKDTSVEENPTSVSVSEGEAEYIKKNSNSVRKMDLSASNSNGDIEKNEKEKQA